MARQDTKASEPQAPASGAPLFGLGRPAAPPPWDEKFKRVSANVTAAVVGIAIAAGIIVAVVLLLIKLGLWVLA